MYRFSYPKIKFIFACVFTTMLLWSCSQEDFTVYTAPKPTVQTLLITLDLPAFQRPISTTSRSMTDEQESQVEEVLLLAFTLNDEGQEVLSYQRSPIDLSQQASSSISFKASLVKGASCNIAVVANPTLELKQTITNSVAGSLKSELFKELTVCRESPNWLSKGEPYSAIPMYGETGLIPITENTGELSIELKRMLARIDVINEDTENFSLSEVYICNLNSCGYLTAAWDSEHGFSSEKVNVPQQEDLNEVITYLKLDVSDNQLKQEAYVFESMPAAESDMHTEQWQKSSCIVIKGKYLDKDYFYRVDFVSATDSKGYLPLLRNHKYEVRIKSANGIGYGTLEDALAAVGVVSNLRAETITYDEGVLNDINFNGQYMLSFSQDSYILNSTDSELEVSYMTDYEGGARFLGVFNEQDGETPCEWLALKSADESSSKGETQCIRFGVEPLPEEVVFRVAYLRFKAGRLRANIEILQIGNQSKIEPPSNSYLVKPKKSIYIPISRIEEGMPGTLNRRNNLVAKFVWTDIEAGKSPNGAVADCEVIGSGQKALLYVETGNAVGNAVIAVADEQTQTILWSWHIWTTDYEPDISKLLMDRNLGAHTAGGITSDDYWKSRGLFYQWGRKDAFPSLYKKGKVEVGEASFTASAAFYYDESGTRKDLLAMDKYTLSDAVRQPINFIKVSDKGRWKGSDEGSPTDSWYNTQKKKKTVFDPCPYGWRVMSKAELDKLEFEKKDSLSKWGVTDSLQVQYADPSYNAVRKHNEWGFFPANGFLTFGDNSKRVINDHVAYTGRYWSSTVYGKTTSYAMELWEYKLTGLIKEYARERLCCALHARVE